MTFLGFQPDKETAKALLFIMTDGRGLFDVWIPKSICHEDEIGYYCPDGFLKQAAKSHGVAKLYITNVAETTQDKILNLKSEEENVLRQLDRLYQADYVDFDDTIQDYIWLLEGQLQDLRTELLTLKAI